MRVRNKALLFLLSASSLYIALSIILLRETVFEFYQRSEYRNLEVRPHVVESLLRAELERMGALAISCGNWDDLRKFVLWKTGGTSSEPAPKVFDESEFLSENFGAIKYVEADRRSGVVMTNLGGRMLFADKLDAKTRTFVQPDPELLDRLAPVMVAPLNGSIFGLVQRTSGAIVMVGAAPMMSNSGTADPLGNVVFFYAYSEPVLFEFWKKLGFRVFFVNPAVALGSSMVLMSEGSSSGPGDRPLGARISRVSTGEGLGVSLRAMAEGCMGLDRDAPAKEARLRAVTALTDLEGGWMGKGATVESLGFRRALAVWMVPQLGGERTFVLNMVLLTSIFTTLVFAALVYAAIGKWLATPVEELASQIEMMKGNPIRGVRLRTRAVDAVFSELASAINALLGHLHSSDESLRKQERLALLGTMQAEFAYEVANPLAARVSYSRRV